MGIFKYCLIHNNSLFYNLAQISESDIVAKRAIYFGIDLLIFSINTFFYTVIQQNDYEQKKEEGSSGITKT